MDEKLIIKKIQALYHDPPEKAIILRRIGHESRAKAVLGEIIDDAKIPEDVKTADYIAAAADRINIRDSGFTADFLKNPVIKHPLSAKEFDLKSLAQIEVEQITRAIDNVTGGIAESFKGENEKIYLHLWRTMLDRLRESGNGDSKMGQLWELLPADTRIPDHSIWDHKRVTSAIAGALPDPAFFLFAIGPVQDFIATARKTQDLWAGSYLLSYLSWSAMRAVAEEFGPDCLIFPDLCKQPFADKWLKGRKDLDIEEPGRDKLSSPTLPNRFLAVVPAGAVKDIAEKAKEHVKKTFQEACLAVKGKLEEKLGIRSAEWDEIWRRQSGDFIETYWAATLIDDVKDLSGFISEYKSLMGIDGSWPFDDLLKQYKEKGFAPNIGTAYGQIYKLTEKAVGSRKAVRDFSQQAEPNHKCTLCGVREPVHPGTYNEQSCSDASGALRKWWQESVLSELSQIRKSERLCAVCSTKRFVASYYFREELDFNISNAFPSVSMVATSSFKEKIIKNIGNPELHTRVNEFIGHIKELFKGNEDRISGEPLPMIRRMCKNEETVSINNRELASGFASLEGDWLYIDSFGDSLKEELAGFSEELLQITRQSLQALLKAAEKLAIDSPSKYYALLLMDGDNMGKWLSGDFAPDVREVLHPAVELDDGWNELLDRKRPLNPSLHLATSRALRDFSLHVVREIVERDHLGKLVYAGGDDVLAFVNLRDLPDVMRKLRAYFSGSLQREGDDIVKIDFRNGSGFIPVDDNGMPINVDSRKPVHGFMLSMGTEATASMGVVIAHHNSNLSQVLDEVRQCEKQAKKQDGKDAYCIALAKRAGGTEHVRAKWYYDLSRFENGESGGVFETIPLLEQWADAFYNDYMSPKMVYSFRTETIGLEGLPPEAVRLELLRIAKRQWNKSKEKEFDEEKVKDLVDGMMNLHAAGRSLDEMGRFLSLAAFLGREGNR